MRDPLTIGHIITRARMLRAIAAEQLVDASSDNLRHEAIAFALYYIAEGERWLLQPEAAKRPHILQIAADALERAEDRLRRMCGEPQLESGHADGQVARRTVPHNRYAPPSA